MRAAINLQPLDGRRGRFFQVAVFCGHRCTANALSTWGMSTYPLAALPSRVVRMEEADERLPAEKRGRPRLHQLLMHLREERNRGRAWSRATALAEEPIIPPRGLGTGRCARLQPDAYGGPADAHGSSRSPIRRWRHHTMRAAPPNLHPQSMIAQSTAAAIDIWSSIGAPNETLGTL